MQTFCAVLLGPPEEIALCALSTHYALAAASFNPGTYTPLPLDAYSLTELLLLVQSFSVIHSQHTNAQRLTDCAFKNIPDNTTYYNQSPRDTCYGFQQNRPLLLTAQSYTTSTVIASPRVGGAC